MYIYDGSKYTEEEIQNAADKAGLSLEEYTSKNNITFEEEVDFPTSTVEDADAVQQPMTASQAGYVDPKNTESPSVDTSSESLDPLDDYYVTIEDLKQDEEDASPALNKKLAGIGISTKQGTSFGSLNALNFENSVDPKAQGEGVGTRFFSNLLGEPTKIFSAIGIGSDKTDEELAAAAAEINEYIKLKADTNFLDKAKKRSGDEYEKYADTLKAPELTIEELQSSMKKDLVTKFSEIQRGELSNITEGPKNEIVGVKQTDATVDQFENKKQFQAYNQWKKDGYIPDFSEDEALFYDSERKQKYALDASLRYASDLSVSGRMDVLALAANDEKRINNFQEISSDYLKTEDSLKNAIKEFELNPTIDNYRVATAIELDYLKKQGDIQSLQSKLKKDGVFGKSKTVPLALKDLNKDYNRVRQLRTSFKSTIGSMSYAGLTLATLAGQANSPGGLAITLNSPGAIGTQIEGATGVVSLGEDLQKETENFQRAIAVDEINSISDAGKWAAGSSVNLVPSLAMAMTGPAAMPLFFLSGSGNKGMEMAVSRKNSSERMIKNKQFLIDNPNVDAFTAMSLEKEMAEDAKILGITEWQSLSIQALYGIAEVAMEKVGTMTLLKNLKNGTKMLSPTTVKEGFKYISKGLKEVGKGIRVEGGSEFGTTVAQNFGDIFVLGEDKNLFEGGLESFAQGALMGGAMNSVGVAKGLRQGYISVLASKKESAKLKENLNSLRKITNQPEIQSWLDLKNLNLKLPKETQSIVDAITLDMQKTEEGVMFKLGSTLSIEQAYKVEEVNRKMRLINKQLIEASTNPMIKASELTQIESQLRTQFESLAKEREQLLSDSVDIKQTKESFVDENVSLDSTLGYSFYTQSMLNESVKSVIGNYGNLSPEANQVGLDAAKKDLIEEGNKNPSVKEIKDKALESYIDNTYKKKIEAGRNNAEAFAKQQGLDIEIMSFEGKDANAQIIKAFEDAGVVGAELVKLKKAVKNGTFEGGEIEGTNKIIINLDAAVKNKRIGIFAHEVLHKYAKEKYGSNQDAINKAGEDLLSYLEKNDKDIFAKVKFRIDSSYTEKDSDGNTIKDENYFEEAMNAMSDVLADGEVVNDKSMNKIRVFANSFLSKLPSKFQFTVDQGRDAYEFVKGYNKEAHFGGVKTPDNPIVKSTDEDDKVVSKEQKESSDKKVSLSVSKQLTPEQDTQLRSDVAEIKEEASKGKALAKQFNKDFVKGVKQTRLENKVLQEIKPIVDRVVTNRTKALYDPIAEDAKKNVSRQMFQESMRSDIESMVFDEFTGKQDLEKFIVNRAFLRANNLAERLGIKSVEEGITKGLEAAEKVAVEETSAPKADKPKYRNILKSNTLPTETVNTIKDKVLKTVRTLKSKLDTKVSINKTVTPLVAEIKKNMGKQADIDFKKAMGGKKDAQLRRFLIKNKRVVLENMTTTWLMGAMPGAVQKQVNGSFTSDWQGKKIDREKTSTQQAGRTSGAEIVRRLPNAFKNLDDKTYLSYIIDESGAPIRGRKESLAKAMAEELSFDIFTAELQNEDSDIRKALEGNQKALGVVLADNYVQEVTRDVERGTVKFSKGALPYVGKLVKLGIKNGIDEVVDVDGNILVNLPGMDNIDTKGLGSVVRKAFDIGLVPDGKELRFLQSIQGSKIIPQSVKDSVKRAITSKSELTIRKALAEDMVIVANSLGSDVTNIIGFDGLGFFNRLLDSAKTKKDKITGEIIPGAKGDFYDTKVDMIKNQPKSSGLPINYNGAEVSPMNSKTGVMGKISRILNKDITAEQKMKEYEKLIPEIGAANVQNKILAKYIITKLVNLVQNGKISPKSFISILQAQTNATAGLRSLTGLKYITFKDGPQGNMKGEHLADNGTSMFEIAELGFENNTKKELSFKIDGILEFHDQWLENRETLDFVDQFGKNNPNKDLRIRLLANKDQVFVYTYDLKPAEDLITERESAIKSRNALEKSIDFKQLNTVDAQQKAINNGRSTKFSKSSKKIRVFDFDDTLARTKSNVLYTMPGEVRVFHGGDIKSVKDIDGFVYFSEDQKQAAAYAKGNQGEVSSFKIDETSIATENQVFDVINALGIKPRAGYAVDESSLYELIDPRFEQSFSKKDLEKLAVALKRKGIKAARFTDTNISQGKNEGRETENIVVFDKKTVQEQAKLTAAEFAAKSDEMAAKGADFDFIEFSKVMNGQEGPLLKVAKIIAEKRGTDDLFVLTARPQDAAGPIQDFLAELGLDIPLENITGLADGNPKAKADWMVGKVAEGYNDFYFADDHLGNVKAVKDVFNTFDVKGKVQQAKIKFSKGLDKGFNDMIERQTGTESFKEFSKGVAQRRGKKVGKFKIFVSPSAEDFRGLTQYKFAGKGKQGEADQKFFEEALMDPYFKGVAALESAREVIKNDTKALFKIFKPVKKKLNKLVPGIDFTYDGAVRVFLWNKAGIEIPGLTKRDNKKLNDIVANDPELSAFADALLLVSKQDTWPAPTEYWEAKTTLSDLNTLTEKTNRKEYLQEFIENVDIIFSEKNLNKVEALYGKASRTAIENAIYAMKTGSNSPNQNGDVITNRWLKWVNNSIGTIMFFNRRSALLQLTSATNFLNWSDNNPAKAALAFANQPQYWKDWAMIFNSDKLKQRRSGLKSDVQESEIANAAKNTEDKIGSIIAYLLKIGFSPTQIADSIAISSGGATFYRNRVNTYKKQGLDVKEAETKAFEDMSKLSDEAQQSGDPALVSQQQRSVAGRLILSFQNTTMQYTRLMKKSGQDLINRRGDPKTHISKILYYGALMNFIFNALSQTAFALIPGFDEEEEEDKVKRDEKLEEKASRVLNGMADSIIRGTGIYGAVVTTLKNTFNTWKREADKGFKGDQAKTILEAANISPAIGSKLRKIYSAIQAYQFDKAIMEKHPWSVTIDGKFNPSATYSVIGNLASAGLNLPLDRALAEARGVAEMFDNRNSEMQRIALALGWRTWNVGAKNEEFDLIKMEAKAKKKEEGKIKAKETRAKNRKIKKLENERRDKAFNTLNSTQRKEIFQMNTTDRRAYLDKIAKQKGIK